MPNRRKRKKQMKWDLLLDALERRRVGVSVIVPAVFEEERPVYELLSGMPLIVRTLMALNQMPQVEEIILVVRETEIFRMADLCKVFSLDLVKKVVAAKEVGLSPLMVGVYECKGEASYIAVCDPLCPFVTEPVLKEAITAAEEHGAGAPAYEVRDTIKIVQDDVVCETPDRTSLRVLQSPLVVESSLLKAALQKAHGSEAQTGDVPQILEDFGLFLRLVEGREENIRIAQVTDIPAAEAILQWR